MKISTPAKLGDLIQRLYSVFSAYVHVELAPATPTCPQDARPMTEVREQLISKTLENLTASDLLDYYYLAVEHIGDADDLRHFLPRILEQMLKMPEILTPAHLPTLLGAAEFAGWPVREREIIVEYAMAAAGEGIMQRGDAARVEEMAGIGPGGK